MAEDGFIPRDRPLAPEEDYEALRAAGMARIRTLSGAIWTDHNASDPGITLLEALAYAVTDLGYRLGFPTADLLTRPDGTIGPAAETGLFPPHETLPCAPITIADHRQLLMRLRDVRGAWLDPMQDPARPNYRAAETPLYADCGNDRLTHAAVVDGEATRPVRLTGLYKVLLQLETDDLLGPLGETALSYRIRKGPLKGVIVGLDSADPDFVAGRFAFDADITALAGEPAVAGAGRDFTGTAQLELSEGGPAIFEQLRLRVIEDRPRPLEGPVAVTAALLQQELAREEPDAILWLFWAKQRRRTAALARARCVLNAHRPLCEDWLEIAAIAPFRIGVCANVDIAPSADLERIQAEIFRAIELYLAPPVRWQTLDALLEAGLPADEIHNGPHADFNLRCGGEPAFVKPGFLTRAALEETELRRRVHVSDIINVVCDIAGVLGIRNVSLRAFDAAGMPIGPTEEWTLEVPAEHIPVLQIASSKIMLFKQELPYRAREGEFRRTLDHLRALTREALYVPADQKLPAPAGRWRGLDTLRSVQDDLPRIYGTGPDGLSPAEPAERLARARQLKAYLAFFDWLLADWLGQLAGIRRLLSPDPDLAQSYFPALPDAASGLSGPYAEEVYADPARLADPLVRARLTETEEMFFDRRSRALDHLLARFAERFSDYALMSFALAGGSLGTPRQGLARKAAFLAEAPLLSRDRSAGFDYRPETPARIWDTDNVPGLQKRVARLLGIADYSRRDLHCAALFDALFQPFEDAAGTGLRITTADGGALFASEERFADAAAALAAARSVFARLRAADGRAIDASGGVNTVVLTLRGGGVTLHHADRFETALDALARARAILARHDALLHSDLCGDEGLHVIEHILLRPRRPGDRLMQVCLPADCENCGAEDPYSFRLHVVLPYWPARFRSQAFRRYAERLIREETPAHIHARICWIDNAQMTELDAAWRGWLEAAADGDASAADRAAALDALIGILGRLRTVNPPASLHDCAEGEDETVVRLDASSLGLF